MVVAVSMAQSSCFLRRFSERDVAVALVALRVHHRIDLGPEFQMDPQELMGDFFELRARGEGREIGHGFPHLKRDLERI